MSSEKTVVHFLFAIATNSAVLLIHIRSFQGNLKRHSEFCLNGWQVVVKAFLFIDSETKKLAKN